MLAARILGNNHPRRGNKKPATWAGFSFGSGSPGRIRTSECLSQSQVPYRLATGLWS